MSLLIERLRSDALVARKTAAQEQSNFLVKYRAKVTAALLSTLISEASMIGKNKGGREPTDFEVAGVVERFLTNATDNLAIHQSRAELDVTRIAELVIETEVLPVYMPEPLVQLTDVELSAEIATITGALQERNLKQMGAVMGALKKKFEGRYNGDSASKLVKAALA